MSGKIWGFLMGESLLTPGYPDILGYSRWVWVYWGVMLIGGYISYQSLIKNALLVLPRFGSYRRWWRHISRKNIFIMGIYMILFVCVGQAVSFDFSMEAIAALLMPMLHGMCALAIMVRLMYQTQKITVSVFSLLLVDALTYEIGVQCPWLPSWLMPGLWAIPGMYLPESAGTLEHTMGMMPGFTEVQWLLIALVQIMVVVAVLCAGYRKISHV